MHRRIQKTIHLNIGKRGVSNQQFVRQQIEILQGDYDQSQTDQLTDSLTLVDKHDNIKGSITKIEGHLKSILTQENALPHRAFSLFHFNNKNELLLQKRSSKKITFPQKWTNTCCSHNAHVPSELEINPNFIGMRRAILRRIKFELGIDSLLLDDIHIGNKILYYAEACEKFAEYELDYIAFSKGELDLSQINPDEVSEVQYVGINDIHDFLQERKTKYKEEITPWFKLILQNKLRDWWKNLIKTNEFPKESHKIEMYIQQ